MSRIRIYGAIMFSMVFWALSFVWFKIANETLRPLTIVFFRLILAVLLLNIYLVIKGKFQKIKKKDRMMFFWLAVFEPFLYFIGESNGLTYVSSTTGSVLISTIPVIASIAAWIVFREKLRLINYAGIVLSFLGIIVFVLSPGGKLSFNIAGLLLLGLAVVSAVGYNLTLSRLVGSYSPVFIVYVQNVIGAILFLPIFFITEFRELSLSALTFKSLLPVVELSVFASCGAFILFAFSVRDLGVTKANAFTNFIPIFTAIFAFFIMDEKFTVQKIAGMVIVITGLFLSQSDKKVKPTDDALLLTGKTA